MHQINSRAADFRLPAPIAFAALVKCVERDLPDEANHFRPVGPNDRNARLALPAPRLF